jgi:hypothetical protein
MRRREAYAQHPQPPVKIDFTPPTEPPRAEAGCCPNCGKLVGQRLIRAHAKTCTAKK